MAEQEPLFRLFAGGVSIQGLRRNMEDESTVIEDLREHPDVTIPNDSPLPVSYIGVFDGHGGAEAAIVARDVLHFNITSHPAYTNALDTAIREAFWKTDQEFCSETQSTAGTTAVVALIRGNELTVANAGDCRCVLFTKPANGEGVARALSDDHRPEHKAEEDRVTAAGGTVHGGMVSGILSVSRAIGDPEFKYPESVPVPDAFHNRDYDNRLPQVVSSEPDIKVHSINADEDRFIVLASDGLWDVVSNEDACKFILRELESADGEPNLADVARSLAQHAVDDLDAVDNVSVCIATFAPLGLSKQQ